MIALLLTLSSLALAWLLGAQALMRAGRARPEPSERFDAIVVLGCRVRDDGEVGPAFARRIEAGCALLAAGAAPKLVVTGGKVGGPVTEASAARAYVEKKALAPLDVLVLEDAARSTRENATCVRAMLGDARVLVVTTDWHVSRACRIFARSFSHVRGASAEGRLRGALREVPLWLIDRLR